MSGDWSTYALGDFLMFSPDTYWRLVATYSSDLWHLQLTACLVAAGMLWLTHRGSSISLACIVLAFIWLVPAYAFFLDRYATIMIAAPYFAGLFFAQAVLFSIEAIRHRSATDLRWRLSLPLLVFALALQPFAGYFLKRDVPSIEGVALMPDTTAVFSVGVLLLIRARCRLYVIPLVWLVISALTLYAMADNAWLILAIIVIYGLGAMVVAGERAGSSSASQI